MEKGSWKRAYGWAYTRGTFSLVLALTTVNIFHALDLFSIMCAMQGLH